MFPEKSLSAAEFVWSHHRYSDKAPKVRSEPLGELRSVLDQQATRDTELRQITRALDRAQPSEGNEAVIVTGGEGAGLTAFLATYVAATSLPRHCDVTGCRASSPRASKRSASYGARCVARSSSPHT